MITWKPARPVSGRKTLGTLSGNGNFVRVYVDNVLLYEGEVSSKPLRWLPEHSGRYVVRVDWYVRGAAMGGGWAGSGYDVIETFVSTEVTTVSVGDRLRQKFGWGNDTGFLVLYVWDDKVEATTLEEHGEITPAFEGLSSTVAETAAGVCATWLAGLTTAPINGDPQRVLGYLIDLVNEPTTWNHSGYNGTLPLPMVVQHFMEELREHVEDAVMHATFTDWLKQQTFPNTSKLGLARPWPSIAPEDIAWFQTAWQLHSLSVGVNGPGTNPMHDGTDTTGALKAPLATDGGSALVAIGELVYCYDRHRLNTYIHLTLGNDPSEGQPVFPDAPLFQVPGMWTWGSNMRGCMRMHYEWARVIRSQEAQAEATAVNTAATTLSSLGGFTA